MYERSSRSPKSLTNSSRSSGVRAAQCRPSARRAVSPKSKISSATLRTAPRRSRALSVACSAGSSSSFSTRSTCNRSWSVGAPASASRAATGATSNEHARAKRTRTVICRLLDLAEDVLGKQLLEVHGRLDLTDLAARRDELVGAARADPHVFLADQPLRLDRGDRVLLELDALVHAQGHPGLVVGEPDRLDPTDLDAGDLHRRAGLQAAHGREVHGHGIAGAAEEGDPAQLDRQVSQREDAEDQEKAHGDVDARPLHQSPPSLTARPRARRG